MRNSISIITFLLVSFLFSITVSAYEAEVYPNEVKVQLTSTGTPTLLPTSIFQMVDTVTGDTYYSVPNQPLQFSVQSSSLELKHLGIVKRTAGTFKIRELKSVANESLAIFVKDQNGYRGASTNYAVTKAYKALQGVQVIGTFQNATETWFNIRDGLNVTSWIPSTSVRVENFNSTILTKLSTDGRNYRGSFTVEKNNSQVRVINNLDIENYLKGVVASEMPSSWNLEALKAQAVSARSYAINSKMLTNTTTSQVYKGYTGETAATNKAVEETKGLIVKYNGRVVETFFYSTSGGKTANIHEVWNSVAQPYYVSVDDTIESNAKSPYSNWTVEYSVDTILSNAGFNPQTDLLLDVRAIPTGANGEIGQLYVTSTAGNYTVGVEKKATELDIRKFFKLTNGWNLYSNWFTLASEKTPATFTIQTATGQQTVNGLAGSQVRGVSSISSLSGTSVAVQGNSSQATMPLQESISKVTLTGKGFGHRIGMSQYGARARADAGWKYDQIIKHYFPGTTISPF